MHNYIKKYWSTNKLPIFIFLYYIYVTHSASKLALEKYDQPTKNLDVLRIKSGLHQL